VSRTPPRLLRPGLISREQLETVLGPMELGAIEHSHTIPSPGLLTKHYSPRTPLMLCATLDEANRLQRNEPHSVIYRLPENVEEASARLYADLHALDARGWSCIIVVMPPDWEAWRAVRDRLTRAAAK
jgi:L-threonylcarbamoyladenylate synthase